MTWKWRDFNPNNQARTKNMQSTLFTELTASEEANLSGGFLDKTVKIAKVKQNANGGIALSGFNTNVGDGNVNNTSEDGGSNTNGNITQ